MTGKYKRKIETDGRLKTAAFVVLELMVKRVSSEISIMMAALRSLRDSFPNWLPFKAAINIISNQRQPFVGFIIISACVPVHLYNILVALRNAVRVVCNFE